MPTTRRTGGGDDPEQRRVVPGERFTLKLLLDRLEPDVWKGAAGADEPRASLRAARATGHRVREKGIGQPIEIRQQGGLAMRRAHQRQPAVAGLHQRLTHECTDGRRIGDLSVLYRRLEPAGMRKPARRKSRVRQLPQ